MRTKEPYIFSAKENKTTTKKKNLTEEGPTNNLKAAVRRERSPTKY